MREPCTFVEVIALWPRIADLAKELGLPWDTVRQWRLIDSIPPMHWPAIVRASHVNAAQDEKFPRLTFEMMANLYAKRHGAEATSSETA